MKRTTFPIPDTGPYMFRVMHVVPSDAPWLLARCLDDTAVRASGGARMWRFPLERGALAITSWQLLDATRGLAWPLVRCYAQLLPARGFVRIPVEIEILPWDDGTAEIGMRPDGRWPPLRGVQEYYRLGSEALELLRVEIEAWQEAARAIPRAS